MIKNHARRYSAAGYLAFANQPNPKTIPIPFRATHYLVSNNFNGSSIFQVGTKDKAGVTLSNVAYRDNTNTSVPYPIPQEATDLFYIGDNTYEVQVTFLQELSD